MHRVVLLRHGQSIWNREKVFTGWTDVGLSPRGFSEAERAADILTAEGYTFDVCFTSVLERASETARIVLERMNLASIPVHRSWRLNERHYGALQGLSFWKGLRLYGPLAVVRCQRQYSVAPPMLTADDPRFPGHDPAYADVESARLPFGESLADTLERVRPYWEDEIVPVIRGGKRALIVAHRNSLRALLKHLESIPDALAPRIKVPSGALLVCEVDDQMRVTRHFALEGGR